MQNKWLKELALKRADALLIYDLLEWCDAFSLLICQAEMQPEERRLDISTGPDKKMYQLVQSDEQTLSVEPWPFETGSFTVRYDHRLIEQIQFKSSEEFRELFLSADVKEKEWVIRKQNLGTKRKKI